MTYSSYERQHLALYAAGFINGAGTTRVGFGCELTRVSTGVYAAVFGADAGLVNDESFTQVSLKTSVGASGLPAAVCAVEDTSNLVKTIFVQGLVEGAVGTLVLQHIENDLEVAIYRSVTRL